ncbi:MAG TPA: TonB family protein [Rhizomicrobium sp.]|jgi:TonB family protein
MIALFLLAAAAATSVPPVCDAPGLTPPRSANSHAIESSEYPDLSRRLNEEGVTIANILVDDTGKAAGASVLVSSGAPRLDDATIDMITHRWLYLPAMRDGKPVACLNAARVIWHLSGTSAYDLGMAAPGIAVKRMGPADYPASARAAKEEGVSSILLHVLDDGTVETKTIVSGGYADLDAAAAARVRAIWDAQPNKPKTGAWIFIYAWKLTPPAL